MVDSPISEVLGLAYLDDIEQAILNLMKVNHLVQFCWSGML